MYSANNPFPSFIRTVRYSKLTPARRSNPIQSTYSTTVLHPSQTCYMIREDSNGFFQIAKKYMGQFHPDPNYKHLISILAYWAKAATGFHLVWIWSFSIPKYWRAYFKLNFWMTCNRCQRVVLPRRLEQFVESSSPQLEGSHEDSPFYNHICCC